MNSWFALDAAGRESLAAEAAKFIGHIIVADVHKAANPARKCMFDGQLGATTIAMLWHIQHQRDMSQSDIVTKLMGQ